jgi:hypothetical protein
VQEQVKNILKISEAKTAGISFCTKNLNVVLEIWDDGKGFIWSFLASYSSMSLFPISIISFVSLIRRSTIIPVRGVEQDVQV